MTKAEETKQILREIIGKMVTKPEGVEVGLQEAEDGSAYFPAQVAPQDEAIVIGYRGTHALALEVLVANIGLRNGSPDWSFKAITPSDPGRTPRTQTPEAIKYDPAPIVQLLSRTLRVAGIKFDRCEATIPNGFRNRLCYNLTIEVESSAEYAALASTPKEIAEDFGDKPLIGALGYLFRAMGRNAGVELHVAVTMPMRAGSGK